MLKSPDVVTSHILKELEGLPLTSVLSLGGERMKGKLKADTDVAEKGFCT